MAETNIVKKMTAVAVAFAIVATGLAPEAWAEDEIVGEIAILIADDFAGQKEIEEMELREERTGKFYRIRFQDENGTSFQSGAHAASGPSFKSGERVALKRFRRVSDREIEVVDRSPGSIESLGAARPIDNSLSPADGPSLNGGTVSPFAGPMGGPLTVPAYNSRPGAHAKLFLDFDGHFEANWGGWTNVTTPPYDTDGDTSSFSAGELANIHQIWRRVAENFAPFNINVTTVDPGNQNNKETAIVAFGGSSSDWYGASAGGVAYLWGFSNGSPNTSYVFENNLGNGNPGYCAAAASHEAGHLFGLSHQQKWSGTTLVENYSTGNGTWAPIMGVGYYAPQDIWHNGTAGSPTNFQDDLAIITSATNGFGYMPDEFGDTNGTAFPLSGVTYAESGIIAQNADVDRFRLSFASPGTLAVTAQVSTEQPMLDAVVNLYDSGGSLLAQESPSNSFSASLNMSLAAGTYYVEVKGIGIYGHIGKYALNGSFTATGGDATPPVISNVNVTGITASGATVTWTTDENADSQAEFGLTTAYGSLTGVNSTLTLSHSRTLSGLAPGTLYHVRARSRDAAGNLGVSTDVTFTTASSDTTPPSITNVIASNVTHNSATITWNTNEGATSRVEYGLTTSYGSLSSLNGSMVTSHSRNLSGLAPSTLYHYRAVSADASGNQAVSADFTFTTNAAPPPNSPPIAGSQSVTTPYATPKAITLTATDPDGQQLGYIVVGGPSNGVLSGTAPNVVYTPSAGFSGADSFSFVANDGVVNSQPAVVSITVSPPDAASAGSRAMTVLRNVIDPTRGERVEIDLNVGAAASVKVHVFDRAGNLVREFSQDVSPGSSTLFWDGKNASGEAVASGAYYLRMKYDSRSANATVAVVK